jgi:hypothetical protein
MQHPDLTQEIIFECMEAASANQVLARSGAAASPAQWQTLDQILRPRSPSSPIAGCAYYDIGQVTAIGSATTEWLIDRAFTQDKKSVLVEKLQIELFVDDRHENCEDVAVQTEALVFMPHRPHNQAFEHPKVRRIRELDEVFAYLTK